MDGAVLPSSNRNFNGDIFEIGRLFFVTKVLSIKLSEEPESIRVRNSVFNKVFVKANLVEIISDRNERAAALRVTTETRSWSTQLQSRVELSELRTIFPALVPRVSPRRLQQPAPLPR